MPCRSIFLLLAALPLGGCTIVQVSGAQPSVQHHWGFANIQMPAGGATLAVSSKGLGLVSTPHAVTLGWSSEVLVSAPDGTKCQVFVFLQNQEQFLQLQQLLSTMPEKIKNICVQKGNP